MLQGWMFQCEASECCAVCVWPLVVKAFGKYALSWLINNNRFYNYRAFPGSAFTENPKNCVNVNYKIKNNLQSPL